MRALAAVQKPSAGLGQWTSTKACRLTVVLTALVLLGVAINSLIIVADGGV
jgi:hypothetical protein